MCRNSLGKKNPLRRSPTPDEVDRALVKLVRAGAPQSLLWADPRTTNLDELPYDSLFEQAVAEAQAEYQRRLARQGWSFRWISYIWSALGRLRCEWPVHMPPLGRVDR